MRLIETLGFDVYDASLLAHHGVSRSGRRLIAPILIASNSNGYWNVLTRKF
jgi:hypothetical protein